MNQRHRGWGGRGHPIKTTTRKRIQNNKDSLRSLWDNSKHNNICIIGVPEEEGKEGTENLFEEIMMENFPNLMKEIDIQHQEVQSPKEAYTKMHIIIEIPKAEFKERILKAARENQSVTYKGMPIRLSANFSTETLQARRAWHKIFKVMNTQDLQPRLPSKTII